MSINNRNIGLIINWIEGGVTTSESLCPSTQSAVQDQEFLCYHLKGFEERWIPLGSKQDERIYREVYTSPTYLAMEEEVCAK